MRLSNCSLSFIFTISLISEFASATGIRGAIETESIAPSIAPSSAPAPPPTGTLYSNVSLCMETNTKASNDHYFWLALQNSNKKKIGGCLLTIPNKWPSGDNICCQATNTTGGTDINYSSDGYFGVADPVTITDTSSQQYADCGANGGPACVNYTYDKNEIGFQNLKVKDGNNDMQDISDRVHLWIHDSNGCGLTHKADTLCYGKSEYKHFHIGKGYCLEGGSSLEYPQSGCQAWGYKCNKGDC